ncbi:DUF5721 family protein [Frisingicoccus sp.]|uniref:DUF5721 family protein n=1 Tax=Frisingicoccus sp. TaxID=1918627 RepID=UPI0015BEE1BA|nr:DUF5721 family protein [Frisingicoccus sp.]MEE0751856.1 DUF5721 family protein [Frisingicoccus sp.]
MIGLSIQDIKNFMAGMLTGNMFDKFYLCDGEIQTFTEFHLGGYLNRPYFDSEEWENLEGRKLCLWSEMKPFAFQLIRGHKLPVRFKFVFQLSRENTVWLLEKHRLPVREEDIGGLFMNITYEHQKLVCTSGVSYKTFIMDKTLEQCWDETVCQYFKQNHIAYLC